MTTTIEYYDSIAFDLTSDNEFYYNGSLLVDIHSDPSTFIDQDVDNIIKYSKMGNSVLECGCGGGYFFNRLIKKKPKIKYQGIDISPAQIEHAKIVNPKHQSKFQVGSWDNLPFENETFDTILFLETIGYAEDVDKLVSECYRVLKPGGTIFSKHPGSVIPSFDDTEEKSLENIYYMTRTINHNTGEITARNMRGNTNTSSKMPLMEFSLLSLLGKEYGYTSSSLGMLMNHPFLIKKLEENNFSIPEGLIIPNIDSGSHIKLFFIEEVHEFLEGFKYNDHTITVRFINGDAIKFWENVSKKLNNPDVQMRDILSPLGKKHPGLCTYFIQKLFPSDVIVEKYDMMAPCVIFTAIKQ